MEYNILLLYFYMMPKVHKKLYWKTRPVISGVSLVLEPLSKFLDLQLQKAVHLCPAYLKDSWQFLNDIRHLSNLTGYSLVTADAVLMYTNINTEHAISTFADWFKLHNKDIPGDFPRELVLNGLAYLMRHNVFSFSNSYFLQLNGTAMGTNVACMYATIYYNFHEERILLSSTNIFFYRRLIDDAFLIVRNVNKSTIRTIQYEMDSFSLMGKRLKWEVEEPKQTVNFLDLMIGITNKGNITTKTFQKQQNTYLYWTPTSCQPPLILKSFIYGTLH